MKNEAFRYALVLGKIPKSAIFEWTVVVLGTVHPQGEHNVVVGVIARESDPTLQGGESAYVTSIADENHGVALAEVAVGHVVSAVSFHSSRIPQLDLPEEEEDRSELQARAILTLESYVITWVNVSSENQE